MAVRNGAGYVGEALDGILRQTFPDFEVVVVNDGSTDDTRRIVLGYGDPRIQLLDNACPMGLAASLNRGLAVARGQYVARHDADDVSEPTRLAAQLAFLDRHASVAVLGTAYWKIDEHGSVLGPRALPCETAELRWALLFYNPFLHSAAMFRRAIVAGVGGYDETLPVCQDYELWSRIARSHGVANLPERLVRYRANAPGSLSVTLGRTRAARRAMFRIQRASFDALFGVGNGPEIVDVARMTALYAGWEHEMDADELADTVAAIRAAHAAFCRRQAFAPDRRDAHWRGVARRLVPHVLSAAHWEMARGRRESAVRTACLAMSLSPTALASRDIPVLAAKLVSGARTAWSPRGAGAMFFSR